MLIDVLFYGTVIVLVGFLIWRFTVNLKKNRVIDDKGYRVNIGYGPGMAFVCSLVFGVVCLPVGFGVGYLGGYLQQGYIDEHCRASVRAAHYRLSQGEIDEVRRIFEHSAFLIKSEGHDSWSRAWLNYLYEELYKNENGDLSRLIWESDPQPQKSSSTDPAP